MFITPAVHDYRLDEFDHRAKVRVSTICSRADAVIE